MVWFNFLGPPPALSAGGALFGANGPAALGLGRARCAPPTIARPKKGWGLGIIKFFVGIGIGLGSLLYLCLRGFKQVCVHNFLKLMMVRLFLFYFVLVFGVAGVLAQNRVDTARIGEVKQEGRLPFGVLIDLHGGWHLPGGDMLERYYGFGSAGLNLQWISSGNWLLGAQFDYQFGERVRIDVLEPLRTSTGEIINSQGNLSEAPLSHRGYAYGLRVGRLMPLNRRRNARSGLEWALGLGYWQHWIRIRVTDARLGVLDEPYRSGYDRLTTGLQLKQFFGYRYTSRGGYANFFGGIELAQGFTRNRRAVNYDTGLADHRSRLDLAWGLRVGVFLPFFIYTPETESSDDNLRFY